VRIDFSGGVAVVTCRASGIGEACVQVLAVAAGSFVGSLDVGDASVDAAVAAVDAQCGVPQRTMPPEELTMGQWSFVARVDLRGAYPCRACERRGDSQHRVAGRHGLLPAVFVRACQGGPDQPDRVSAWGRNGAEEGARERVLAWLHADARAREGRAPGRLVQVREIAQAVAFLASAQASAVAGINLPVDAGYLVAIPWAS